MLIRNVICLRIRLKQNKYPVMFLTQGVTSKWPPYHDLRCQGVPMAVHFAVSSGILVITDILTMWKYWMCMKSWINIDTVHSQ